MPKNKGKNFVVCEISCGRDRERESVGEGK